MSMWHQAFTDHPLWEDLKSLRSSLNEVSVPDDEESQDALAYIGASTELLEQRREGTNSLEVTIPQLDATRNAVASLNTYLQGVPTQAYTIAQAAEQVPGVINSLSSWPPILPTKVMDVIDSSLQEFQEKALARLNGFREQVAGLNEDARTLRRL